GNIISNAIKFSPNGSHLNITVYPVSKNIVKLEFKDNGIGIPDSILTGLFNLKKKTSRSGTNGESGTGFGMHIMKSFVEMYGGSVKVESKVSNDDVPSGTTVILTLKGNWD